MNFRPPERRVARGTVELRVVAPADPLAEVEEPPLPVVAGYAAVFGRRSVDLGGFTELIDPGAFTKTITEADVVALWNHDMSSLMGRVSSSTLRLAIDAHGLAYDFDPPDTTPAHDLVELIGRGDVTGSSFGFRTVSDEWLTDSEGRVTRTLLEVELIDVSPVALPAYPDTDAALRSLCAATGKPLVDVRAACEQRAVAELLAGRSGDPDATRGNGGDDGRDQPTVTRARLGWLSA